MAHKINSKIFHLGISQSWESSWMFTNNFSNLLLEDLIIRLYLTKLIQTYGGFVQSCLIKRSNFKIFIVLNIIYLKVKKRKKKKKITFFLKKKRLLFLTTIKSDLIRLTSNSDITFKIINNYKKYFKLSPFLKISKKFYPYYSTILFLRYVTLIGSARLFSRYLVLQLQKNYKHNNFFEFLKSSLKIQNLPNCLGLKFELKGRLNGNKRKKKNCYSIGKISLSTLFLNVDYHQTNAFTKYGIIGIKVWLNCRYLKLYTYNLKFIKKYILKLKYKTYKFIFLKKYYGSFISRKYKISKISQKPNQRFRKSNK